MLCREGKGLVLFGRDEDCDVLVENEAVSDRYAGKSLIWEFYFSNLISWMTVITIHYFS